LPGSAFEIAAVVDPGHVVLGRAAGIRLELPAEQRAPERARLRGVVGRDLDVDDLAGHRSSLRRDRRSQVSAAVVP
jgi:hypothetical protein